MKITIEKDNGTKEVFQNVTDLYLAVRQKEPVFAYKDMNQVDSIVQVRSYSWGENLRELVKELQQSLVELQDFLREKRNGGSS